MITFLFYHKADLDGYLSGYILKRQIINNAKNDGRSIITTFDKEFNLEHIREYARSKIPSEIIYCKPYNYDDDINIDKIRQVKDIVGIFEVMAYFVDCSPHQKNNYFEELYELLNGNLRIIDHHATSIEYINKFEEKTGNIVCGKFTPEYSGCELTAMYITGEKYEKIPDFIKLLGRYDVHDVKCKEFDWDSEILPFQYGFRNKVNDLTDIIPLNCTVEWLLTHSGANQTPPIEEVETIRFIYTEGSAILEYIKNRNKLIIKDNGHECKVEFRIKNNEAINVIDKLDAYIAFDYLNNSLVFGDEYCDPEMVYMIIRPYPLKDKYSISIYSTPESNIDVSSIAQQMGGGGHKHASGFTTRFIKYNEDTNELRIIN